jgi:tryptophan 2,3-dioxygenase
LFYRLLLAAFVLLSAALVYIIVRQSRARVDYLPSEVSLDSIEMYARRADSLGRVAAVLAADIGALPALERPQAQWRLGRLREEIAALETAVERWRVARDPSSQDQAFRECILLYGRASGMCEVLREPGGKE